MIPTTVTSSSSTPSVSTAMSATTSNSNLQNSTNAMIGIASLILEGRAIYEDEFQSPQTAAIRFPTLNVGFALGNYKDIDVSPVLSSSGVGGIGSISSGSQSPRPSTSRAAACSTNSSSSSTTRHAINITTNPAHLFGGCTSSSGASSMFDDFYDDASPLTAAATSESTHQQRWAQKLCQLRQASPAGSSMSRDCGLFEQKVGGGLEAGGGGEPELVALAINTDSASSDKGDFEIFRRVMLNRPSLSTSAGSAASSPGSTDNFLHSLQSLATTCLRGGGTSPAVADTSIRYNSPNTPFGGGSVGAPKYNNSNNNNSNTMFRSTPSRCSNIFVSGEMPGSASSSGSGFQSPLSSVWSPCVGSPAIGFGSTSSSCSTSSTVQGNRKEKFLPTVKIPIPTNATNPTASASATSAAKNSMTTAIMPSSYPQQGPHCEQFLRKMGLAKGEAADAEDHYCDMSYVNITCSRWRAYCLKMEAIILRDEPVCIEVYLGPVGHKILLEQWILTLKEKVPSPTMTLSSLCSAIRSQLYFSQISAWCDLIKKSDNTIFDTGRVIFSIPTGAAGDLATVRDATSNSNTNTPGTSPSATGCSPSLSTNSTLPNRRPRLNIFYRIKQYDSTACFNSKPNIHNFPNVTISDNCSISVCLKSLPRINGGIPKLGVSAHMQCDTYGNGADSSATCSGDARSSNTNATATTSAFAGVALRPTIPQALTITAATTPKTSRHSTALSASPTKTNCDINKTRSAAELLSSSASSASTPSCQSKGKHKCMFFIDEDELLDDGGDDQTNEDDDDCAYGSGSGGTGDSPTSSYGSSCHLSHRERQLMKYRKRMLKRDKKTTRTTPTEDVCAHAVAALEDRERFSLSANGNNRAQPMEQGEEEDDAHVNVEAAEQQLRNSHHNEQYSISPSTSISNRHVAMVSTGTQTQLTCCQCGSEKALICLNCDSCSSAASTSRKDVVDPDEMDSCSISSSEIIHTPRNNAELLLQAIQRTPKAAKNKKQPQSTTGSSALNCVNKNNNHIATATAAAAAGCQVCKRQKTQHDFSSSAAAPTVGDNKNAVDDCENITVNEDDDEDDGGSVSNTSDDSVKPNVPSANCQIPTQENQNRSEQHTQILDKEYFISSTKLTPYIDKCSLYNRSSVHNISYASSSSSVSCNSSFTPMRMDNIDNNTNTATSRQSMRSCTPPNCADPHLVNNNNCEMAAHFKTPTNAQQEQQLPHQLRYQHKQTPKPTLLQISTACQDGAGDASHSTSNSHYEATVRSAPHNSLLIRKGLPKVNLTPIFCNPSAAVAATSSIASSLPIPISSCPALCTITGVTDMNSFTFDHVAIGSAATTNTAVDNNNIPVQKSFSAPTLPNSPSLSPRFAKQAAIYKRRSRHLSDRSDRSSLGSDEQFSDEDLECGTYSPATSPMKMRSLRCAANFGRRPLLGNLEESLFQKRFAPKIEVTGFKVLLGASGGFCPTQLTIPAAAYFYELHGETLSMPYVCEIRLPRKGYSVPRAGTVQATLLNPMGTVVRMFVIPYDMRDMPPLHQTFIRQRILADSSSNEIVDANAANSNLIEIGSNNNTVGYHNGSSSQLTPASLPMQINGIDFGSNNDSNIGEVEVCGLGANNDFVTNTTNNNNNNNNMNNNNLYRLSPNGGLHSESNLGHLISAENMKRLRYSIHLRFQTSRSGRLSLHTDIRLLISRRTDCDTAAAHAKGVLEAPNDLITDTVMPTNPKYSARQESPNKI